MRRPLIAGNWKMHKTVAETSAYLEGLIAENLPPTVDVVCCPTAVSLPAAAMLVTGSRIGLGAQNVHWEASGAFTAELAAPMLTEIGVHWVIVGHSERRTLFGETDETALDRACTGQAAGLEVIYCIGETLAERDAGETFAVLERQTAGLGTLDPEHLDASEWAELTEECRDVDGQTTLDVHNLPAWSDAPRCAVNTRAPCSASIRAVACPMPDDAPKTRSRDHECRGVFVSNKRLSSARPPLNPRRASSFSS